MKIYIGADHNGYDMKQELTEILTRAGYEVIDEGDTERKPDDDFPIFAAHVVHAMRASDDADPRGILICGSGQGMCMAANRFKGIRASLIWEVAEAWLATAFAGAPRYKRRIKELDQLGED